MVELEQRKEVVLDEVESKLLLKEFAIPVVEEHLTNSVSEAVGHAEAIGFPVVLKGVAVGLAHKSEIGAVITNLSDSKALRAGYETIERRVGKDLKGITVQPQVDGKRELFAGISRDENFGPVIMFGVGGVLAEAISDISFRLAPLKDTDIEEMIDELGAATLFGEFRGEKQVNRQQIKQILKGLSELAVTKGDVVEVDINPIKVTPEGDLIAVDGLVVKGNVKKQPELPQCDPKRIRRLLSPKAVAFIGVSATYSKWGYRVVSNVIAGGFENEIYLVSLKEDKVLDQSTYKTVASIPKEIEIDLAVVTIPADKVLPLFPELAARGVKGMLLITSGFREVGEKGQRLEEELVAAARAADIMILGPNTKGISNPHQSFYCNSTHLHSKPGDNAVISQSGNLGAQLIHYGHVHDIGLRLFIGSGNEAMVTIEDYLDFLVEDELTTCVLLYLESVKNGRRFYETARNLSMKKPVVTLKGGCSRAGNLAAASHSGAMASDVRLFEAACRQAGIVQVATTTELLDLSTLFSSLPLPKGNRVAVVTFGGGWGVVTADQCENQGLILEPLPPEIIGKFDQLLPDYWSRANPVDIVGEGDLNIPMRVVETLMQWDGCDAVIHLGIQGRAVIVEQTTGSMARLKDPNYPDSVLQKLMDEGVKQEAIFVEFLASVTAKYEKPIIGVGLMTDSRYQRVSELPGHKYKVVLLPSPDRAVKAMAGMVRYSEWLAGHGAQEA